MTLTEKDYDMPHEKAWCPGCGHFTLQKVLRQALADLEIPNDNLVFVSGIGQAAKLPQYTKGHMFNGLHGRALPAAMAVKACNPNLTVIVDSGDGCSYGEGGNHFLAQMARNSNIVQIVHNNMIYGLTKGQASPTSPKGLVTPVQVNGVTNEPFNPLAVAIAMGATFVARVFAGNMEQTKEVIKQAIQHKGYALIDSFVPCVSMNKINTFKWYKENTYELESSHDKSNQQMAFARALETGKYPTGIFYQNTNKRTFVEESSAYKHNSSPLYERTLDFGKLQKLIDSKRF
ncbi:2-oxoacid:ferredoxin oxidoreductase 2, subunit beta [Candidatus Lokiarchaeum ossiferum]|uniref:2-oxoacid:ferredoxin oxidoreductase 2, subunit beta n=1 Tax=Candidatus Lokiarchaeum ossiferum TaxID=2951803 RepID=A0ABY6HL40_9ARCH|nr:2-oxoacid:ferredoxin oxidoreductase 2, subunit beta [Candidatus Lokiarchaeum sp. B-35]